MLILLFRSLFFNYNGLDLDRIWIHFRLNSGSILGYFGALFGSIFGPPSGGHFGRKTMGNNIFHCSGAPGRLSFGVPFGLKFGSISVSFRIPFCSIVIRPEPEENIVKENNNHILFFQLPSPKA